MASARFEIVRKANGDVKKLTAKISDKKQMDITVLNNNAYLHISDSKFRDIGKFNKKQVSLSMKEVQTMKMYLLDIETQVQDFLAQTRTAELEQPQPIPTTYQQAGPEQQHYQQPYQQHVKVEQQTYQQLQPPTTYQQQPYQQQPFQHQPYQQQLYQQQPYQQQPYQEQQYNDRQPTGTAPTEATLFDEGQIGNWAY